MFKNKLSDYTEQEFLDLIKKELDPTLSPDERVRYGDALADFMNNTLHPDGSDLIYYPDECDIEDSPEAVIAELKRWYAEQDLPCFKGD